MTIDVPPLYDKQMSCHICGHEFTSKKIRSRFLRVKQTYNDFSKEYKDKRLNPILYECYVCPKCGYAFSDQFDEIKNENIRIHFKNKISINWKFQEYSSDRSHVDAVRVFKLAIISARETQQHHVVTASLCMKLSWIYRLIGNDDEEKRFIKHSLNEFEKSFTEGDFKSKKMSEIMIIYLIGELNRKLGINEHAVKFFSKVIQHKNRDSEPQLVEKAREQWYEVKQSM